MTNILLFSYFVAGIYVWLLMEIFDREWRGTSTVGYVLIVFLWPLALGASYMILTSRIQDFEEELEHLKPYKTILENLDLDSEVVEFTVDEDRTEMQVVD